MRFPNDDNKKTPAKTVALCGVLTALALGFSYVEFLIPFAIPIPGAKLGLANLITLTGLYFLTPLQTLAILIARILLSGFMFGNLSTITYSLAGGLLSFFMMLIIKKTGLLSVTGVSIVGGVFHNIGQLLVACLILQNPAPVIYLPYLIIIGALAGGLMGLLSKIICTTVDRYGL